MFTISDEKVNMRYYVLKTIMRRQSISWISYQYAYLSFSAVMFKFETTKKLEFTTIQITWRTWELFLRHFSFVYIQRAFIGSSRFQSNQRRFLPTPRMMQKVPNPYQIQSGTPERSIENIIKDLYLQSDIIYIVNCAQAKITTISRSQKIGWNMYVLPQLS